MKYSLVLLLNLTDTSNPNELLLDNSNIVLVIFFTTVVNELNAIFTICSLLYESDININVSCIISVNLLDAAVAGVVFEALPNNELDASSLVVLEFRNNHASK
jgi:hypothetical protein